MNQEAIDLDDQKLIESKALRSEGMHEIKSTEDKSFFKGLSKKALAFTLVDFIQIGNSYVSILFLSKLGNDNLAAVSLMRAVMLFISGLNISLEQPVYILIGNTYGAIKQMDSFDEDQIVEKEIKIGQILKTGYVLGFVLVIPEIILLNYIKNILLFLGQNESISELAQKGVSWYMWALPLSLINRANTNMIATTDNEWFLIPYNAVLLGTGCLASYLFINDKVANASNSGASGIGGYGVSLALIEVMGIIMTLSYIKCSGLSQRFKIFSLQNKITSMKRICSILNLSYPFFVLAIGNGVANILITSNIGRLGSLKLGIFQSASQCLTWFNGLSEAISKAGSVMVAQLYGGKLYKKAKRIGTISLVSAASIYLLPLVMFSINPKPFAKRYLPDSEVEDNEYLIRVSFIFTTLAFAMSILRNTCADISSSLKDVFIPSLIGVLSTLAITLPLSYLLSSLDLIGINLAMIIGTTSGASLNVYRWINKINSYIAQFDTGNENDIGQTDTDSKSSYFSTTVGATIYAENKQISVKNRHGKALSPSHAAAAL